MRTINERAVKNLLQKQEFDQGQGFMVMDTQGPVSTSSVFLEKNKSTVFYSLLSDEVKHAVYFYTLHS